MQHGGEMVLHHPCFIIVESKLADSPQNLVDEVIVPSRIDGEVNFLYLHHPP